jgi:hypothetical protein
MPLIIECKASANVWGKSVCCVKWGKSAFEIFASLVSFLKIVSNLKSRENRQFGFSQPCSCGFRFPCAWHCGIWRVVSLLSKESRAGVPHKTAKNNNNYYYTSILNNLIFLNMLLSSRMWYFLVHLSSIIVKIRCITWHFVISQILFFVCFFTLLSWPKWHFLVHSK